MKNSLLFFVFLTASTAFAQVNSEQFGVNKVESGNQIAAGIDTNLENLPYYPETPRNGYLRDSNGKWFSADGLQYDAQANTPIFRKEDALMRPNFPVNAMVIGDSTRGEAIQVFECGFPNTETTDKGTFFELLYNGKSKLLKRINAKSLDVTAYNSATRKVRFDFSEDYFVLSPEKKMVKLKKDKKALSEALPHLIALIEQKKSFKTWNDVALLLAQAETSK